MIIQIRDRIEEVVEILETLPATAKRKLRGLLRELEEK